MKIFQYAHARKDVTPFRYVRNATVHKFVRWDVRNVLAIEQDPAGPGAGIAAYRHQQCRFARAVRADERSNLSLIHFQ